MGGKGGGRIGRRELQAHGEGGEAGEGCRSGTGSGAWAVRHLGEHVVVRAQQGVGPLFVVAEFFPLDPSMDFAQRSVSSKSSIYE